MAQMGLLSPWENYYKEVQAFFAEDPEVKVIFVREDMEIQVLVDNEAKAEALDRILNGDTAFGLHVTVYPANRESKVLVDDVFETAFGGNGAFRFAQTMDIYASNPMTFVVFAPEVVQYYTDNLGDYNGFRTTLYQEIAKEIFIDIPGVYYCTDRVEKVQEVWL